MQPALALAALLGLVRLDGVTGSSAEANRLPEDRRKGRDGWGPGEWETRNGVSSFGWDARDRPVRCPRCPQPGEYRGNGYDNLSPEWQRRQEQQNKDWQQGSGGYDGGKRVWTGTIQPIEEQPGAVVTNWMGGPQRWRADTWQAGPDHSYHSSEGGYAGSYGYSQGSGVYSYESGDGYKQPGYYDRSRGETGYIHRYNQQQPYDSWGTKNYATGWDYYEQRPGSTHGGGYTHTYAPSYGRKPCGGCKAVERRPEPPPRRPSGCCVSHHVSTPIHVGPATRPVDEGQGGPPYGPSSGGGSYRPGGYDDYNRQPSGGDYGRPSGGAWTAGSGWDTYGRTDYGDGYSRPTTGVTRPSVAGYGRPGDQNQNRPWYEFGRPEYDRPVGPSRPSTDYGRPTSPGRPPVDYGRPTTDYGRPNPDYGRPDYSQPAPPVSRPGTDYGRPTPDYTRPTTDYGRPTVDYGRPAPDYGRPAPDYHRPQTPNYGRPTTDYGRPDYGRPSPDYGRPSPDYGRPTTDYGRPGQDYGRPAPDYGRPAPDYGRPSPDYSRPGTDYGRPIPPSPDYGRPAPPNYGRPGQDSGPDYVRPGSDYGRPGQDYGPSGRPDRPDYGRPSHPDYSPPSGCSTCRPDPEHQGSGGGSSPSRPGGGGYGSTSGSGSSGNEQYGGGHTDGNRRDEQGKPLDRYPGHTGVGAPFEFDSDRKEGSYFYDRPTTTKPTTTTSSHSSTSSSSRS